MRNFPKKAAIYDGCNRTLPEASPTPTDILKEGSHLRRLQPGSSAGRWYWAPRSSPQRRQPSTTAATDVVVVRMFALDDPQRRQPSTTAATLVVPAKSAGCAVSSKKAAIYDWRSTACGH